MISKRLRSNVCLGGGANTPVPGEDWIFCAGPTPTEVTHPPRFEIISDAFHFGTHRSPASPGLSGFKGSYVRVLVFPRKPWQNLSLASLSHPSSQLTSSWPSRVSPPRGRVLNAPKHTELTWYLA